ncbi:pyridoxal phosphate-dependent decarboxylase family protein [Thalassolituus maritimus]|uniref:Aspartate aminotransferase family protein n=1 Tax=Thalassolituus maritimus TaxID=484498 RepID=A0ABP9ZW49_9GAMM
MQNDPSLTLSWCAESGLSALTPLPMFRSCLAEEYQQRTQEAVSLVKRHLESVSQPFSGITPAELSPEVRDIDLSQPLGSSSDVLDELSRVYLRDAVYFHHPRYVAHLNCPVALPAVTAETIQAAINTSVDTWDQSAGATLIEQKLVDWTIGRIGLGENADGIFTSGGTQSNLMGMLLARDNYALRYLGGYSIKEKGLPACAHRFRIFTSEYSHFSVRKAAAMLGLGYDSVVPVAGDSAFRMDAKALSEAIHDAQMQDLIPLAVVATAGTTDFGSVDPLPAIAEICEQNHIWMHVDAAYGCGLLVSQKYNSLIGGIEFADSVTVDFHKSFFQPVACSGFFARDKSHLNVVTHHADYLNPLSAAQEGTPDLVNKSIQTTRRFDALKLWMTLREVGAEGIGKEFDAVIDSARAFHRWMETLEDVECLHEPSISAIVFRYLPANATEGDTLNECNRQIRKALFSGGAALIAGTKVKGAQYLKFTVLNSETSMEDIQYIIGQIRTIGAGLWERLNAANVNSVESSK